MSSSTPSKSLGENEPGAIPRRRFLDLVLGGGVAAIAAGFFYPFCRFILPPQGRGASQNSFVAAKKGELAPNSSKIFPLGSSAGILIRTLQGDYRAFTATCTHLACTVQYRPEVGQIWCACHDGLYDLMGRNIAGPPPRPLEQYRVDLLGNDIVVSKRTA
jgi:Rieske Fe-S protein